MSKTTPKDLVDRYIATWNETDDARRRARVAETFAPAGRYVDPLAAAAGHAEIDAMIRAVQTRFPGLVFTPRRDPDTHGPYMRFSWSLGPAGGAPIAGGTDFAVVDDDGRFATITGFLDALS